MKKILAALALAVSSVCHAGPLAIDFSDGTNHFPISFANFGWTFNVKAPVAVTALGMFDFQGDGLVDRHQVGLWDGNGTLLASATVFNSSTVVASAAGGLGHWLFEDITPVVLAAGTYTVGANMPDEFDRFILNAQNLVEDPLIEHLEAVATVGADGDGFQRPYAVIDAATFGLGAFGPNMLVHAAPEPGSLALVGVALLALSAVRRRA